MSTRRRKEAYVTGIRRAYRLGFEAAQAGDELHANPYTRGDHTLSWQRGYEKGLQQMQDEKCAE